MQEQFKKIVIIGPESTGKTTLCQQLSTHYKTVWSKEFAREYLEQNGKEYGYDDLLKIAKGQIKNEQLAVEQMSINQLQKNKEQYLFFDTDLYVLKVWSELVFNKCHHYILNEITNRKYDFYLLCDIDLAWIEDKLRENPKIEERQIIFNTYKDILVNQNTAWAMVKGTGQQRFQNALDIIDSFFT